MAQNDAPADENAAPSLGQTFFSTLAAFFGVQSSANRRRDFTRGKASHFIIMGVLATVGFVGIVMLAVKFALATAK